MFGWTRDKRQERALRHNVNEQSTHYGIAWEEDGEVRTYPLSNSLVEAQDLFWGSIEHGLVISSDGGMLEFVNIPAMRGAYMWEKIMEETPLAVKPETE